MARSPRLHVPGGCYHVTLRGNHREAIFASQKDRHVLNKIVAEVIEKCGARVHAFCWMTNHLHMLVQVANLPLGDIVRRIAQRYAKYRHAQLKTSGHLFERRHGARFVGDDSYFLTVLKYIHLNPVSANISSDPSGYSWSSHNAFLGNTRIPWLTTDFGLSLFSHDRAKARAAYRRFMSKPLSENEHKLIEAPDSDRSRIIGTDRYLQQIGDTAPVPLPSVTLGQLAVQVCAEYDTTLDELLSPKRSRAISDIRAELARRAIEGRVANLTGVAGLLRRSPSSVHRLLDRRGCGWQAETAGKKTK